MDEIIQGRLAFSDVVIDLNRTDKLPGAPDRHAGLYHRGLRRLPFRGKIGEITHFGVSPSLGDLFDEKGLAIDPADLLAGR